jgi:polar amino acid transport system substrate-binding protein
MTFPPAAAIAGELASPTNLTICLSIVGAPAATVGNDGTAVGYNVAFANEIASRLSVNPVIRTTDFSELTTQVTSHACDISVSSQNITAQRTAQMNLIPYTQAKLGFPVVVSKGNPKKINSLTDLCGLSVAAAAGTTSVDAVLGQGDYIGRGLSDQCVANKKKPIDLKTYPSEADAVQTLLDFGVAAYLGNANFVSQYPDLIQTSTATLPAARQGIAVALDHPNLTAGVEAALGAMINDGTYIRILSQYLPADDVANFSIVDQ